MDTSIVSLFERVVATNPKKIALVTEGRTLTYAQLDNLARELAGRLALTVRKRDRIAFCFEKDPSMIMVAILAILKLGAIYIPIDPRNPQDRVGYFLDAVRPILVVGDGTFRSFFENHCLYIDIDQKDESNKLLTNAVSISAEDPAYIIFTSGSTGNPKAVQVSHGNLASAYVAWESIYGLKNIACHLQVAGYSFDVFAGDWIRALCSGAQLTMCSEEAMDSPERLYRTIEDNRVECIEFLPTLLRALVNYMETEGLAFNTLHLLICGSDAWYVEEYFRFKQLLPPRGRLINSYGTSETTIDTSLFEFTQENEYLREECTHVPIGKAFPGMEMLLLASDGSETSVGKLGELYIGGSGVSLGYLDAPELNAAKFVHLKNRVGRYFRTGDYARVLSSGDIEFVGRNDTQIKFRGRRIDLAEIENVLLSLDDIENVAVIMTGQADAQELWACLVPKYALDSGVLEARIREGVGARIPPYALPQKYLILPELPTNLNGKIDRRALQEHDSVV